MKRAEIIAGFHKVYQANLAKETARVGAITGTGISMDKLKEIFNQSVADYVEEILRKT